MGFLGVDIGSISVNETRKNLSANLGGTRWRRNYIWILEIANWLDSTAGE
jgi:hypothetical protein